MFSAVGPIEWGLICTLPIAIGALLAVWVGCNLVARCKSCGKLMPPETERCPRCGVGRRQFR